MSDGSTQTEEPCEVTGKPCRWIIDDWEDSKGNYNWDSYCWNCYRNRDWSKEECPDMDSSEHGAQLASKTSAG